MTSTVTANMSVCDKKTKVTASLNETGEIELSFETNCANVKKYIDGFEKISIDDVTTLTNSAVMDPQRREHCSATCLVPSAIIHAAWLELGMLSKSRTQSVGSVSITFEKRLIRK